MDSRAARCRIGNVWRPVWNPLGGTQWNPHARAPSLQSKLHADREDAVPIESMIVFAAREAKKMWPFLAGFAVVGFGVTQATLGITEADKKKSAFLNPGGHH